MIRKLTLFVCFGLLALLVVGSANQTTVKAEEPNAWTTLQTNLRQGPATTFATIATVPPNTGLFMEARTRDYAWLLVRTTDGTPARGWASAKLLKISPSIQLRLLPISTDQVQPGQVGGDGVSVGPATPGPIPTVILDRNLDTPILPVVTPLMRATARSIVAKGKALGNNLSVFSKVGDCMSDHWAFLSVIGYGKYSLGQYGALQGVIDHFYVSPRDGLKDSWDVDSQASHNGFSSTGVLDKEFANTKGGPALCNADESPLLCEYRLDKPGVAVIMFGTADVLVMTPREFNYFMREIVKETMDRGVIPLLSTFPENPGVMDKSNQINQVIITIAQEKGLPVVNLQKALQGLPNNGIDTDNIHLTIPPDGNSGVFDAEHLKYGYTVRNLVTMQALDIVWKQLLH